VLEAAAEAFASEGYRVSIDRIASLAGVARQTLYNHFESKEALFDEVVRAKMRDALIVLEDEGGHAGQDVRSSLLKFATIYRRKLLDLAGLATFRVLIAEAPRFPELARGLLAAGPVKTVSHLARFLEKAMARGELRSDDPVFAAEMLSGMLTGFDRLRGLLDNDYQPLHDTTYGERAVDCFLRAYRPD
jgi:TetR/AcrR family transcriptional regulator, mexJK operon transcriptional repressor